MGQTPFEWVWIMTTILIADDDALVRTGLGAIFSAEDDFTVVGEAPDGEEAVALARKLEPDVVVMDIRMPKLDGLAAATEIIRWGADAPKILVLTTFELDEYVYEALRIGAAGFLLKRVPPADLIEAVRVVASGESMVFPAATRRLVERFASTGTAAHTKAIGSLTDRERDVFRLVAKGHSNREIADELFVGIETVKSHVGSLLLKLDVRDRTQAVIMAYESGFSRTGQE